MCVSVCLSVYLEVEWGELLLELTGDWVPGVE
jgi:hypothetical protein